jgi:hypothetical protein
MTKKNWKRLYAIKKKNLHLHKKKKYLETHEKIFQLSQ